MTEKTENKAKNNAPSGKCRYAKECGGCSLWNMSYREQLKYKQRRLEKLLGGFGKVESIIGMEDPLYYRNKVHHGFVKDNSGNIITGPYEEGSHWIINARECLIEDKKCQEIAATAAQLCRRLHVPIYNEKTGNGTMRRILVRRALGTGEIMVVLVVGSGKFAQKADFAHLLVKAHPDISTVISNLNDKRTSMILGDKQEVLYGPGYIMDELCGLRFRISAGAFYQVNYAQTQVLYSKAMEFADLKGEETVIDAYCGIGTIGLVAAGHAGNVIGVELNPEAVADARENARLNGIQNARFICGDATEQLVQMAQEEKHADVVFMDPPRSGSTIRFMKSVIRLKPERIVYISCGPESLAKNLTFFTENGYEVSRIQPVDMFCQTGHVEVVSLLSRTEGTPREA